jgi:hypothetical protein
MDRSASLSLNKELSKLVGITETFLISPLGQIKKSDLELPTRYSKFEESLARNFAKSYEKMNFTFPKEPLGIGASWNSQIIVEYKSAIARYVTRYKIISFKNNILNLEVQNNVIPIFGFEQILGSDTKTDNFSLIGRGKVVIDLEKIMPISVDQDFRGKLTAHSISKDSPREFKMENLGRIKVIGSVR